MVLTKKTDCLEICQARYLHLRLDTVRPVLIHLSLIEELLIMDLKIACNTGQGGYDPRLQTLIRVHEERQASERLVEMGWLSLMEQKQQDNDERQSSD